MKRNVLLLSVCQALMMSCNSLIITTSVLVGFALAADKLLAALPLALMHVAAMCTSIPASLLMGRAGRKVGFMLAAVVGATGGVIATFAIIGGSFWLFCLGIVGVGIFNGFGNYYRFAAAEIAEPDYRSRAISYVMAGGVVAAFVGPNLANWTKDVIPNATFAGCYASLIAIYVLSFTVVAFTSLMKPVLTKGASTGRPLSDIMTQPRFVVAVICGMFGYGIMSLVMTATPLAMQQYAHSFSDTALVIQWHVLAMFAPSFFTGHLINRLGLLNVMLAGALLGIACITVNLSGHTIGHFWLGLFLLGLSWNFLFIGATTLLTETYQPEEKPKTQAVNDFMVFSTVAMASLSAGVLQHSFGWWMVNVGVIPLVALVLASLCWLKWWRPQAVGVRRGLTAPH